MSKKTTITESEYWSELDKLSGGIKVIDEKAVSSPEWAKRYTSSESHARKKIFNLINSGKLEMVWKYNDGGQLVHAYRPKKK